MTTPTKAVYGYYFPEVRHLISEITTSFPHELYLQAISPGLDDFHLAIFSNYLARTESLLPGLSTFKYRYPTSGASEGIFHTLAQIVALHRDTPLYVLKGEYEGYSAYGANLGLKFESIEFDRCPKDLTPGIFFISNPSARDGNIIPNEYIAALGEAGHEIILDLTYFELTEPHTFLVDHPAISTVFISFSKPYGVYYHRIGFTFCRKENLTLSPNKWFKNILSLLIARRISETFKPSELSARYRSGQQQAIANFNARYGFEPRASNVILLAYAHRDEIPKNKRDELVQYLRGNVYRFCLTPYLLDQENLRPDNGPADIITLAAA